MTIAPRPVIPRQGQTDIGVKKVVIEQPARNRVDLDSPEVRRMIEDAPDGINRKRGRPAGRKLVSISTQISEDMITRLGVLCDQVGQTRASLIRIFIQEGLERHARGKE